VPSSLEDLINISFFDEKKSFILVYIGFIDQ
jgi:hypothetical protein